MAFNALRLENFRSFIDQELKFADKTVIVGGNGSGKSTLVEALRLLSVGKSFRTHKLDELIRFDQPFFRLQIDLKTKEKVELFYGQPFADYPDKERRLSFNGKEVSWLEFFGQIPTVVFSPEDIQIVAGSPQIRRRYLDGILWQVDGQFRSLSLELSKVLQERSRALFLVKINRAGRDELQPWNEMLAKLTKKIRTSRVEYLDFLNQTLSQAQYRRDEDFAVEIKYNQEEGDFQHLEKDEIRLAQNLWGPHRDEVDIFLNDRLARRYASRGQSRTLVMLLKIIESTYLHQRLNLEPVVLLDDLFSELDSDNIHFFIERLEPTFQIIATAVEEDPAVKTWRKIKL